MDLIQAFLFLFKYIFLGIVQGVTEPIPISSSGHLILLRHILDIGITGLSFEIIVNTASLCAIFIIYRTDIKRFIINGLKYVRSQNTLYRDDFFFLLYLIIATIPAAIIGLLFEEIIESHLVGIQVVGITLIITGFFIWMIRHLHGYKGDHQITLKDAILIGFAQSIALIPGISRSGATIIAAMLLGLKRETALRFSFLLYIPISVGVMTLSIPKIINDPNIHTLWLPYFLGFLASFIASLYALQWFMGIMKQGKLKYFAYYCVIVGFLIIWFI